MSGGAGAGRSYPPPGPRCRSYWLVGALYWAGAGAAKPTQAARNKLSATNVRDISPASLESLWDGRCGGARDPLRPHAFADNLRRYPEGMQPSIDFTRTNELGKVYRFCRLMPNYCSRTPVVFKWRPEAGMRPPGSPIT